MIAAPEGAKGGHWAGRCRALDQRAHKIVVIKRRTFHSQSTPHTINMAALSAAAPLPTVEEAAAAATAAAAAAAEAAEAELIIKEAKEVDTSAPSAAPDRVKRAEAVLRLRTDRVAVVLECPASVRACTAT